MIKTITAIGSSPNTKKKSRIGITINSKFSRISPIFCAWRKLSSAVRTIITGKNANLAPRSNVAYTENVR